ncbi:MAG: glycoside hydrolase family 38 C-terminal domain-containing protein, partial [Spirochaetota bacterium]
MSKLNIYYFSGTHWDREWYQSFQGFRYRLVAMMDELIEVLNAIPDFKVFHLDGQTVPLEDYLEVRPEKKNDLSRLIKSGRIIIGPWYIMPDEFLLSGESLIRNLLKGKSLAEKWGVKPWKYGYMCDVFGHIAQMPQILNGFGIRYALLGRGTNEHNCPAHFIWRSPAGDECITFKLKDSEGYGAFCTEVIRKLEAADNAKTRKLIQAYIDYEISRSEIPVVVVMDAMDHEKVHRATPEYLKIIGELYPQASIFHANLEKMGKELEAWRSLMPVKAGELNEPARKAGGYLYLVTYTLSSRYPLKQANDLCQNLLERWVEPLMAVNGLRGFKLPRPFTDIACTYLLKNHGHDSICGCSIDQVHKDMAYRFDQARLIFETLVNDLLYREISAGSGKCSPFVIQEAPERMNYGILLWNPLPYSRKEVVTIEVHFKRDYPYTFQEPFGYEKKNSFILKDYAGREIPFDLVTLTRNNVVRYKDQNTAHVDIYTLSFEVELPPCGTTEYLIEPVRGPVRYLNTLAQDVRSVENEYISLHINGDGTLKIKDKSTQRVFDRLLSYLDDGEIGDGWYHVNPVEDRSVDSTGMHCRIERIENGPSRTVFQVTRVMEVPEAIVENCNGIRRSKEIIRLTIVSRIGLSRGHRYVDVETKVFNTAKDHRLRLKLPTGINTKTYFASQPFAFVERKTGIDLATDRWKECSVPEKQMSGIVGKRAEDGTGFAFVSCYGLHECAVTDDNEGTVFITLLRAFGKTVMTNGEEGGQVQEELDYSYCLVPLNPNVSDTD